MIDWRMVAANGLWILGLSILLSVFSYHDWLARETRRRRRDLFKEYSFRFPWTSGMFLVCVGWGLGQAVRWWEKALWFVLAAWFGWEMLGQLMRAIRGPKPQA
ncbi:MAG: hypothetical protein A3H95_14535 [Acidobacteria bacterium RIFCSPLOWO2_02_FULL_64_15]|nr:MAG: hypothetical protein A3H95_14535 [Acidobacteria bacterium RIFCSPLOWO2_02_FULL_64_15]